MHIFVAGWRAWFNCWRTKSSGHKLHARQGDCLPPKGNHMGACHCTGIGVPSPTSSKPVCAREHWQSISEPIQPLVVASAVGTGLTEQPCFAWRVLSHAEHRMMLLLCSSWERGRGGFLHLWYGHMQEHFSCSSAVAWQRLYPRWHEPSRQGGWGQRSASVCVRSQTSSTPCFSEEAMLTFVLSYLLALSETKCKFIRENISKIWLHCCQAFGFSL